VTPPFRSGIVDLLGRWIPLNFVYLGGAARMAGLHAEIYDAMAKNHGYTQIEQHFRQSDPSYIASTAITSSIKDAIKTLELAKRINPHVVTILGGIHPTFCSEEILNATSAVDYIICSEGEVTLRELLRTLETGGDPDTVSGLVFCRERGIVKTSRRTVTESFDDFPAAWDLLDWEDYTYFVIPDSRLGAISTFRASDHDSTSCPHKPWENDRHFREPAKVVAEIVELYASYGVNVLLLTDEFPTSNRDRWELFLDLMIKSNLPVYLLMQARAADIVRDRDIMWKYRRAGVVHIYINIEAVEQAPLDSMAKGMEVTVGKLALAIVHEQGIITETSFVIGGPDETKKNIEHTLKQAQDYNPDNAQFLPMTPWPYDNMENDVRQCIVVHDYAKYNLIDPVIEPRQMSLLQIDVAIVDCYRRFYMKKLPEVMMMNDEFKRGYLMRAMKLIGGSSFILKKMGMGTLGKIPAMIEGMRSKDT